MKSQRNRYAGRIATKEDLSRSIMEQIETYMPFLSDDVKSTIKEAKALEDEARGLRGRKADRLYQESAELYEKAADMLPDKGKTPLGEYEGEMRLSAREEIINRASILFAKTGDRASEADCYEKIAETVTDVDRARNYYSMANGLRAHLGIGYSGKTPEAWDAAEKQEAADIRESTGDLAAEAKEMVDEARELEGKAGGMKGREAREAYRRAAELYRKAADLSAMEGPTEDFQSETALYSRSALLFDKIGEHKSQAKSLRALGDSAPDPKIRKRYHKMATDIESKAAGKTGSMLKVRATELRGAFRRKASHIKGRKKKKT